MRRGLPETLRLLPQRQRLQRQPADVRVPEAGRNRVLWGASHAPRQGTGNQNNLIILARWSADGLGQGTLGKLAKSTATRRRLTQPLRFGNQRLLANQAGVIADTVQNRVGPKVGGLPANGFAPGLHQQHRHRAVHVVRVRAAGRDPPRPPARVLPYDDSAAFNDNRRTAVYDFWDFTVKDNASGVTKPGRLFSKQWAFSAGATAGVFSATFSIYPLIPESLPARARYFVKKFELAGIAPQRLLPATCLNSMGSAASTTDFTVFAQEPNLGTRLPEYSNFVNDPDPAVWPSADDPT
ncbi:MAG: hypothetical protein WKG07_29610 [Hymenobacter sp.]